MQAKRDALAQLLAPFLAKQARAIAAQITDAIATTEKADVDPKRVQRVLDALDFSDWSSVAEGAGQVLAAMAQDGGSAGLFQIGVSDEGITDQVNAQAVAWATDRGAELVGMRYTDAGELEPNPDAEWAITDSTREMLRSDVETVIEEGLSTDDLASALEARYAFSPERADTIARTEIARADVAGNLVAYRESGVVEGKEWALASEHDGEDECDEAAALGVVPLDDDFGGIGDPPAHPNCECDILPVVSGGDPEAETES